MKITLKESQLRQIVTETVRNVLKENLDNLPEILRMDPTTLSDDELRYCCKFLASNADEYEFNPVSQEKFDSFYDELNNRNGY